MKRKRSSRAREPKYRRLTAEDRIVIETLRREGKSNAYIATALGVDRTTVWRETRRNAGERGYRHKAAEEKARDRVKEKASRRVRMNGPVWEYIKERIAEGWTPETIHGRARREGRDDIPCKETIYKEYYRRQSLVRKGESGEELPPLQSRRHKRKTRDRNARKYRNAGRGKIPGRVDIAERPKSVENRARVGNWEGDLINGLNGTGNLVTLVERMTRFTLFAYSPTKETEEVVGVMAGMLADLPPTMLVSLTLDNGKEFAMFKELERRLGVKVYFAKPYHSWERGTNENRNGIVRRVLPKGSPFDHITDDEARRIDSLLNDRPMKCLEWRTPREAFTALRQRHSASSA